MQKSFLSFAAGGSFAGCQRLQGARADVAAAVQLVGGELVRRGIRPFPGGGQGVRGGGEGLAAIASGVERGSVGKGRLKPAPALAFYAGLDRRALPAAELGAEDARRYLRRQEVGSARFAEGMNLVCAGGRALGFAKRIGGRVNNLYPDSLRILKNE